MAQNTCSVKPPSDNTLKCIFPFKYLGKTYSECTFDDDTEPWCATALDMFGNMVEGSKGRCEEDCVIGQPEALRFSIISFFFL